MSKFANFINNGSSPISGVFKIVSIYFLQVLI